MDITLDIIIPCRFKPEITQTCIDSVKKYTNVPYTITIIQDGQDEEMNNVLGKYGISVYNKEPQGWIKAINQGMERIDSTKLIDNNYVIFLNDDVVVTPDWIEKMVQHFKDNENLGVLGCITNQIDNEKQHISNKSDKKFEEVEQVAGFCIMFKKEVLKKLKEKDGFYLDERFEMGGQDDTDICWRARQLGYKVGVARDVFLFHYGSKAFREMMTNQESREYAESRLKILNDKYKIKDTLTSKSELKPEPETENKKPKVLIAIPSIRGALVIPLVHNLMAWSNDTRYDITVYTPMNLFPLDNARNRTVKEFLEMDYDYLWFIDDDICPPVHALEKLISADKDIIGAVAFSMRSEDGLDFPYPVTLKYNKDNQYELYIGKGIEEVDSTGGACIMYKRHVFEHPKMERPYKFKYHRDGTLKLTCDFVVHQKAQSAGFKIFIDFDLLCSHIRDVDIKGINNLLMSKKR